MNIIISAKRGMCNNFETHNVEVSHIIGEHPFDNKTGLFNWPSGPLIDLCGTH